jgi:parallel beta-helix repeat protein
MRKRWLGLLLLPVAAAVAAAAGAAWYLQQKGVTPRALAPYVERRSLGHNPTIERIGRELSALLQRLDRGADRAPGPLPAALGAQAASTPAPGGRVVLVGTAAEARQAFSTALPGDVITFLPGTYRFDMRAPEAVRPGAPGAPVTVRAIAPGSALIEMNAVEGFLVTAPYWTFENLTIRGVCGDHASCEHAFHVVGNGHSFAALNNTISDFNAHFKINGDGKAFPDRGRIDGNTLTNASVRATSNPVTPIDIVAASGWRIRRNIISDFIKGGGDGISYGAFAKGGGSDNLFEQNAVLCEHKLQGQPGQRVGLSLGGGGTGKDYCRDLRCITEQDRSELRNNLVASCSDAGIYLNRAAASVLAHNSVIDTAGVQLRSAETSARAEGNLVDGAFDVRGGALLTGADNLDTPLAYAYAGYHPQRRLFASSAAFDFTWDGGAPRRADAGGPERDLCGSVRMQPPAYGAIEDFRACMAPRKAGQP